MARQDALETSFLYGGNAAYIEELQAAYARDPNAVDPEWQLRVAGAPRTALRLDELTRLPWRRRPRAVGRWLIPSPAVIRMRDPRASEGPRALAAAYARRLGDGIRDLPTSVRALRATRER